MINHEQMQSSKVANIQKLSELVQWLHHLISFWYFIFPH